MYRLSGGINPVQFVLNFKRNI